MVIPRKLHINHTSTNHYSAKFKRLFVIYELSKLGIIHILASTLTTLPQRMMTTETACGAEKQYQDLLKQGKFQIQQCQDCKKHIFYPRMICPHCGSDQLSWIEPTGLGTVYSTTVVRRKAEDGGNYNVALINLDEGVRLMSRVEKVAAEDVYIGQKVKAHVQQDGEQAIVVFSPVGE